MFKLLRKKQKIENSLPDNEEIYQLKREISILRGVQEAMPDPYYVRDMDYNIILWPKAIQDLTGYSEEEAKRIKCFNIFKAEVCKDCPTQKCVMTRQFLKDALVDIYRKNGEKVIALVSNAGVYDEGGQPIGAVEIIKDNTNYYTLMGSIIVHAEQLSAVSQQLAASGEEVAALSNELNNQSAEVFNSSIAVQNKSENGTHFAYKVKDNMTEISRSMGKSVEGIELLRQKSEVIINIVTAIASQTNLLALNASIEAARAGEAG